MSSNVHQRKGTSSHDSTTQSSRASTGTKTNQTSDVITDAKKLVSTLSQAKEVALSSGLTQQQFERCAERASKQMKLRTSPPPTKSSRCGCMITGFKIVWLMFLMLLALALLSAAVKPVMFYMHKMLHTHMYSITRPVRLGLVSLLPYFKSMGLDFLHQDCLLENPLVSADEKCPCTHIKYPTFFTINSTHTQLPHDLLQLPLYQVIVVENGVSMPAELSIDRLLTSDPVSGAVPVACTELTVEGQNGVRAYPDLFNKKKMKKLFQKKEPWTFSWEECPDTRNLLTLRSLLPPTTNFLPSDFHLSTNALFTITNQWALSSYYHDVFPGGRLVLTTVVVGELRLMIEPQMESQCVDVCSGFKGHPVLKQGDSVLFDQQFWSFQATTWSDVALTYSIILN